MIIENPYDTSFGKLINTKNITNELMKYLTGVDSRDLNYEFTRSGDNHIIFITGYNDEEQELPIWEHPLVFTDSKNREIVAVDIRKYVKKLDEQPLNIYDVVKDKSSLDFLVLRSLLTLDFINGDIGLHRAVYKHGSVALGVWMSTIVNALIALNPLEKAYVEIAVTYYASLLFVREESIKDMLSGVEARVSKGRYSVPIPPKAIGNLINKLNPGIGGISGMIHNINQVLPEDKQQFITEDAIVNMLGNSWYGPGSVETIIMSLEHMPTWLALLCVNSENKSYKRTKIATVLEKGMKVIKPKEIIKHFELYLKEIKI